MPQQGSRYNPHFHLIVPNKQIADIFIKEWLKLLTIKFANKVAQHSRKVSNVERDLIEIVKYGSKIFTEPDINKKSEAKNSPLIYVAALNNILCAMKGHRIFERFGFNLPSAINNKIATSKILYSYDEWIFDPKYSDWIGIDSEQLLSGYLPSVELRAVLNENINKSLE